MLSQSGSRISFFIFALIIWSAHAIAQERLEIPLGHSEILAQERAVDVVIVGNSDVADATLIADRSVLVTGLTLGQTNLILVDEAGRELHTSIVDVVPVDRRPTTRIRVMKGNDEDRFYICGPDPGCEPRLQGDASAILPPALDAEPRSGTAVRHLDRELEAEPESAD